MTQTHIRPPAQSTSAAELIQRRLHTQLLTRGRVVIIGLGGIGLFLTRSVVLFIAGLLRPLRQDQPDAQVHLLLVDGDSYDAVANSYRMDLPGTGNKAVALGQELLERFQREGLSIRWIAEYVTPENVGHVIRNGDCVLLACDNHATRRLVGRRCAAADITDIALVSGGNDALEGDARGTYGNVQVFVRQDRRNLTAPLDRYHPEIANPVDTSPAEQSCLEAAANGAPQLVFVNLTVAAAMCNAILRLMMPIESQGPYDEVSLDVLEAVCIPHWLSASTSRTSFEHSVSGGA